MAANIAMVQSINKNKDKPEVEKPDRKTRPKKASGPAEANLSAFFNTINDFLFVLDIEGNIIETNDAVVERLGYSRRELAGKSVLMVHPEERRTEAGRIVGALTQGKAAHCPIPIITKSGRQIPVETRVVRGQWNGQDVLFGVSRDISEIKLAEEKFSRIFQSGRALMAVTTYKEGIYVDVNDAFLSTLGYSREEVIGEASSRLNIFTDPSQREAVINLIEKEGKARNIEVSVRAKSGAVLTGIFSIDPIYVQDELYLLTTMSDITERKSLEKALRASEEKYRNVFAAESDSLFLIDRETGAILETNDAACRLYGYTREELLRLRIADISAEPEATKRGLRDLQRRIPVRYYRKKNGTVFPVDLSVSLFLLDDRQVIVAAARDITDRIKAEEELQRHRDHLEDMISQRTAELREESKKLEDANAALRALLKLREEDHRALAEKVVFNVQSLVLPYLDLLKKEDHGSNALLFEILEANLAEITSPFLGKAASLGFTPREVEVANFIRNGKTIKEISSLLHLSPRSVERHRYNIRKKLNLTNKQANLFSHLLTLSGNL
jgi:PAS domain S-box-containing protein